MLAPHGGGIGSYQWILFRKGPAVRQVIQRHCNVPWNVSIENLRALASTDTKERRFRNRRPHAKSKPFCARRRHPRTYHSQLTVISSGLHLRIRRTKQTLFPDSCELLYSFHLGKHRRQGVREIAAATMAEYMDAPPPVYTAGPKNGTNGTNVSGCGIVYRGDCFLFDPLECVDWL